MDSVVICFDSRHVLHIPIRLAMAIRAAGLERGVVSETALAYTTLEWCAAHAKATSGREFGALAWTGVGLPAYLIENADGAQLIEDEEVGYNTDWKAQQLVQQLQVRKGSENEIVSIGLSMDSSMHQLLEAIAMDGTMEDGVDADGGNMVTNVTVSAESSTPQLLEAVTDDEGFGDVEREVDDDGIPIKKSAGEHRRIQRDSGKYHAMPRGRGTDWAVNRVHRQWQRNAGIRERGERERRQLIGLLEATQSVAGESRNNEKSALELQQRLLDLQSTERGSVTEVPMMLSHERALFVGGNEQCKQSAKTRFITPATPMLVWDARVRARAVATDARMLEDVQRYSMKMTKVTMPFADCRAGATPLWDGGVSHPEWESTSASSRYSVHTPAFAEVSAVDRTAFKLNADNIQRILAWHPHGMWIADGARHGFGILSDGAVRWQEGGNAVITSEEAAQVTEWMGKQVESGRTVPISDAEARQLIGLFVSPVTVAPKPGSEKIRTCHNMSAGGDFAVNSGINFDPLNPIGLLQLDSVVACLRHMRLAHPDRKIRIAKCDLKEFFRQIPLRRRDMARLAQRWNGILNVHTAFTFGGRSAPHVCSVVTNALCDEMARLGYYCQCFIDDCVVIGYEDEIDRAVEELRRLFREFGLQENLEKFVKPTHMVAVVGVWFNTETMQVGITEEKRASTLALLRDAVSGTTVTVEQLRKLGGKLNFLSAVVPFGRTYSAFVWRLAGNSRALGRVKKNVNHNLRHAVAWWIDVLEGRRFTIADMMMGTPESPLFIVSAVTSDACDWGFGGVSETHRWWIQGQWLSQELGKEAPINVRKCFGALLMVAAMAQTGVLNGTILVFQTDNECTMWGVNKGHSKRHILNVIVTAFAVLQERYRFFVVMKHIPGVLNTKSDGISRNADLSSLGLGPGSRWQRLDVPTSVRRLLLSALAQQQQHHVLTWQSGSAQSWVTLETFVLHGMTTPTEKERSVPIPWVAFRDSLALTTPV